MSWLVVPRSRPKPQQPIIGPPAPPTAAKQGGDDADLDALAASLIVAQHRVAGRTADRDGALSYLHFEKALASEQRATRPPSTRR